MAVNLGGPPKGNTNGAKAKQATDALRLAINRVIEGDPNGRTYLAKAAVAVAEAAADGEPWAVHLVFDRLDGKAHQTQSSEHTERHVFEEIKRTIIDDERIENPAHSNGTGIRTVN